MSIFNRKKQNEIAKRNDERSSLETFNKKMNNLFEDFFGDWDISLRNGSEFLRSEGFSPQIDLTEDDKNIYVEADLPGLNEKDIDVELKDNILTISGEKKEENEVKEKKYHKMERSYGYFKRSVSLDSEIDEEKIKANFKNGVLKIELPKDQSKISKSKKIQIK